MNIAVDLTQIPVDKTGIGIYAVNLVREIIRLGHSGRTFNFYFFAQDDDEDWKTLIKENNHSRCTYRWMMINSRFFRKLLLRFFFEQVLLPRKCRKLKIDVIYSLHYTIPYLTRIKRVATIPDMTFYLFPQLHRRAKHLFFRTFIPLSLGKSHRIVTISNSTKHDILKQFNHINPDKIEVIHLGAREKKETPGAEKHLEKFGLKEKKYFLFVGTLEPRKNIPGIIEAFHHVITTNSYYKQNYKLVIAGMKGWFYEKIFETVKKYRDSLEESVVFTGYMDEEVKHSLLTHAFLFLYPSFYEGFGLPVLEAMAYGVPVITGNVSSLPEVSGDAAILVDPHHWQEIAGAVLNLLSDNRLYEELVKKSLYRAQEFSWQKTAQKTLEMLDAVRAN